MQKVGGAIDTAIRALATVLLVVAIWRIEVVHSVISEQEQTGSGQFITHAGVRTERWIDESKTAWAQRHYEAIAQAELIEQRMMENR